MEFGIVQYFGSYGKEKCSYCKSIKETSTSVGMNSRNISEQSYQWLIDRGWRRSGSYCYKMAKTDCCAFYTIRCDALKFELTKSKRKLLNKMNKFLQSESIEQTVNQMNRKVNTIKTQVNTMDYEKDLQKIRNVNGNKVDFNLNNITTEPFKSDKLEPIKQMNSIKNPILNRSQFKSIDIEQLKQSNKSKSKRILKRINRLKVKYNCSDQDAFQMMIKNRKSNKKIVNKLSLEDYLNLENGLVNQLKIKIVLATRETGQLSHELYKKYQKIIHKSEDHELDFRNFERFLISNPFRKNKIESEWTVDNDDLPDKYGCYHMQYWLNDKLIAVNVIDILPNCVSSVYFFYDPDYSFLNLGTYSSLREIELVRKLNKQNSNICFYYMGFYIHSCLKMRYKGNINSSYLLCPETYTFHDYKWCKENFDLNQTCRLALDKNLIDIDGIGNVDDVRILFKETAMTYQFYKHKFKLETANEFELKSQREELEEYIKYVGNKFIYKNLMYLSA